jgi:tRNA U34 2-thiouridine synthase MnmA/TrmU
LPCLCFLGRDGKDSGARTRARVRIPTAAKPDSQEICFVPNGDYAAFIDAYFKEQGIVQSETQGELVTTDGRVVGEHSGVHHFTIGQRRGLGVAAGEPLYVISTEPASKRVVIGRNDALLRATMTVNDVNWISIAAPVAPIGRCQDPQQASRFRNLTPARRSFACQCISMSRSAPSLYGKARYFYSASLSLAGD